MAITEQKITTFRKGELSQELPVIPFCKLTPENLQRIAEITGGECDKMFEDGVSEIYYAESNTSINLAIGDGEEIPDDMRTSQLQIPKKGRPGEYEFYSLNETTAVLGNDFILFVYPKCQDEEGIFSWIEISPPGKVAIFKKRTGQLTKEEEVIAQAAEISTRVGSEPGSQ